MYSDGHEVDGSWVLRVYVTDLQVERNLRVKGELHIGGVMLRLVEDLVETRSSLRYTYSQIEAIALHLEIP
ncbi:Fermitin 2 [Cotesia glomerata]|uniref:Fermitin 2 n=1 Tax=Cotesia glomerata TaxID=32391 RepID=A0AAV7J9J2_COTGL|nr:Fermitin 2 [Cotesia glomerata]